MAKVIDRLTPKAVEHMKKPGFHHDGLGLYLQVTKTGAKTWAFRYMLNGKPRWMGLGSCHDVTLEGARGKRDAQRQLLKGDAPVDPIELRKAKRAQELIEGAKAKTFDECATAYVESHRAGWRNAKHAAQWTATLNTYASPTFGALPVQAVDTTLVMAVLEPLWRVKTETATRLRGRIESILDWATVRGYRQGENPARWRGHLDKLLPKRSKVAPQKHHAALPYTEAPAFMVRLRGHKGMSVEALEFTILTAARISEAVAAKWDEIDLDAAVWTVPAARMKGHREHRVPLSPAAVALLKRLQKKRQPGDYVFPSAHRNKHVTGAACLNLLHDMGHNDLTVHGFRSTFRDWAAERTAFANEVAEAALAHVIKDKAEAAYRRGDMLEKRAKLMQAWADYCAKEQKPASVTPIRGKAKNS
ncbi:MAG: tyrosine-type recombinase/integrase [Gammaproteobacteria bacterium]|nr:tyrosine-type recombinase/integrase [Gammaproteobacteria bacterium]